MPGETASHKLLKEMAVAWARAQGYVIAGKEVSLPHRRFRLDAAACVPVMKAPPKKDAPLTKVLRAAVAFECKQCRPDLIRDSKRLQESRTKLEALLERKKKLESLLHVHLPHLCRGESLFPEFDAFNFEQEHKGYREVIRQIRLIQSAITSSVKLDNLMRYRVANIHYLVVEPGLLEDHEVPAGWGVLERHDTDLVVRHKPGWQDIAVADQLLMLQRIAASRN